jgi:hypothetical protein
LAGAAQPRRLHGPPANSARPALGGSAVDNASLKRIASISDDARDSSLPGNQNPKKRLIPGVGRGS